MKNLKDFILICVAILLLVIIVNTFFSENLTYEQQKYTKDKKEVVASLKTDEDKDLLEIENNCKNNIELKKKDYYKFFNYKDYDSAVRVLEKCSELLMNDELKKLVNDAQIQSYIVSIEDKKTSDRAKFFYINQLYLINPDLAEKYEQIAEKIQIKINIEDKEASKYDIKIGDTKNEINEKWGEPKDIDYHTNQYGSLEVWIYDEITFTFINNKLTSISY